MSIPSRTSGKSRSTTQSSSSTPSLREKDHKKDVRGEFTQVTGESSTNKSGRMPRRSFNPFEKVKDPNELARYRESVKNLVNVFREVRRCHNTAYAEFEAVEYCESLVLDCKHWCREYNRSKGREWLDSLNPLYDMRLTRTPPKHLDLKESSVVNAIKTNREKIIARLRHLQEILQRKEEYGPPNLRLDEFFDNICYFLDDRLLDERQLVYLNETVQHVGYVWPQQSTLYVDFERNAKWIVEIGNEVEALSNKFPEGKGMPTVRDLQKAKDKVATIKSELSSFSDKLAPKIYLGTIDRMAELRRRVEILEESPWSLNNRKHGDLKST